MSSTDELAKQGERLVADFDHEITALCGYPGAADDIREVATVAQAHIENMVKAAARAIDVAETRAIADDDLDDDWDDPTPHHWAGADTHRERYE